MSESVPVRYVALALTAVGVLVVVLSLPASGGSCSGVESIDPSGAYRLLWFDPGTLQVHYTPNGGLSQCYVGVGALTLPIGVGAAGLGTVAAGAGFVASLLTRR
ncbi:hypothetical protein ACFO0N_03455 [Halobium salinum]|uniref:Uncharacterized protein n=1 Tax=Halobium salinum TaxID=1364940 RepID=A0ABD5P810_9EURY|nr:hypothetical protein [Halobium salinum]